MKTLLFTFWLLLLPSMLFAVVDPVGWWKFDAGSGTTAIDSGSGGNNGTLQNTPSWVTGYIGPYALSFTAASSQYVSVGNPSALQISGNITISAWINATTLPSVDGTYAAIAGKGYFGGSPDSEAYLLRLEQDAGVQNIKCGSYYNGNNYIVEYDFSTDITTGTWYNLICRYDSVSTTWKIYLNGVEKASFTTANGAQNNTANFYIGAEDIGSPDRYFDGSIDDVRVYNRALTTQEITDLANRTEGAVALRHRPLIFQ